jgi:hypothetical protein
MKCLLWIIGLALQKARKIIKSWWINEVHIAILAFIVKYLVLYPIARANFFLQWLQGKNVSWE